MLTSLYAKQHRLAHHYLARLRVASSMYSRGDDHTLLGLTSAGQDWEQIQQWQAWSAAQMGESRELAALCATYPLAAGELLKLLLSPIQHLTWRDAALQAARYIGDERAELLHLLAMSDIHIRSAQPDYDAAALEPALTLARRLNDLDSLAHGLLLMGICLRYRGQYGESQTLIEQALELCQQVGNSNREAGCWYELGHVAGNLLQDGLSVICYQNALRLYRLSGDERGAANTLSGLAVYIAMQKEFDQAIILLNESATLFRRHGDRLNLSDALEKLGIVAGMRGDSQAARLYLEEALQITRETGDLRMVAFLLNHLALISFLQEEYASVYRYVSESLPTIRRIGSKHDTAWTLMIAAIAYWSFGEPDNLRVCVLEGLSLTFDANALLMVRGFIIAGAVLYLMMGNLERSALLLGAAEVHLDENVIYERTAIDRCFQSLQSRCDPNILQAAFEHGRTLDLETTARELLVELQEGRL